MGIKSALSRLRESLHELRGNPLNNPAVPLNAAGFLSWAMAGEPTASGERVTLDTALQQITVQSCLRILGEGVASLPLQVLKVTSGSRSVVIDHPLAYLIEFEPNDEMTAFAFWEAMVVSMASKGNGYAEIQRDKSGRVVALWPLHPALTTPKRDQEGNLVYETTDGEKNGSARTLQSANVLHFPLFSFDGVKGLSPIDLARQGIGLARAAEKYGARFFGNGARPGGVLSCKTTDLGDEAMAAARATWEKSQGGENQGRTAVLPGEWTYASLGATPEESQFLATRQFQRAEIAALFRIPPHMVGDTTRLSGANHENMSLQLVTDTFRPYLRRIELEVVRKLLATEEKSPGSFRVAFDVSERLRGDFKTTQEGYATGRQWGWYNGNEVRAKLGENPGGPELDVYFAPVNMQDAKRLLVTESAQDQPVGGDGNEPADALPTPGERQMLGAYRAAFIRTFSAGLRALLAADRIDAAAIEQHLGRAVRSIAGCGLEIHGALAAEAEHLAGALASEQAKLIARRSARWNRDSFDELARVEFLRVVRSLHINAGRELAGHRAAQQLPTGESHA